MKKALYYIACTFLILFLSLLAPFLLSPFLHNYRLSVFTSQFNTLPLPRNTLAIERQATCGKLNGNGNSMDYAACLLIQSSLSTNELESFYSTLRFSAAEEHSNHTPILEIIPLTTAEVPSLYLSHRRLSFSVLQGASDFSGFYALLLYDGSYDSIFDFRAH